MKRLKEQYQLLESIALDFEGFKPFNFVEAIKNTTTLAWDSEKRIYLDARFKSFLIHEVIDRVEKTYFELNCSVGAMAFLERMVDYTLIKHGVGSLLLASCEIVCNVDFNLAGNTIKYHVVDERSEWPLATYVIAE